MGLVVFSWASVFGVSAGVTVATGESGAASLEHPSSQGQYRQSISRSRHSQSWFRCSDAWLTSQSRFALGKLLI